MGDRKGLDALGGCALPAALEATGERWSFLLCRASLKSFDYVESFQANLAVARSFLSGVLGALQKKGMLTREPVATDQRRLADQLKEEGGGWCR